MTTDVETCLMCVTIHGMPHGPNEEHEPDCRGLHVHPERDRELLTDRGGPGASFSQGLRARIVFSSFTASAAP